MLGIGLVIAAGRSPVFADILTRLIPIHDGQMMFGAALGVCGLLIAAAPLNTLFPLLTIPFLMFTGGEFYYLFAVSNNGVIAIAAAALEVITLSEMFKHHAIEGLLDATNLRRMAESVTADNVTGNHRR